MRDILPLFFQKWGTVPKPPEPVCDVVGSTVK